MSDFAPLGDQILQAKTVLDSGLGNVFDPIKSMVLVLVGIQIAYSSIKMMLEGGSFQISFLVRPIFLSVFLLAVLQNGPSVLATAVEAATELGYRIGSGGPAGPGVTAKDVFSRPETIIILANNALAPIRKAAAEASGYRSISLRLELGLYQLLAFFPALFASFVVFAYQMEFLIRGAVAIVIAPLSILSFFDYLRNTALQIVTGSLLRVLTLAIVIGLTIRVLNETTQPLPGSTAGDLVRFIFNLGTISILYVAAPLIASGTIGGQPQSVGAQATRGIQAAALGAVAGVKAGYALLKSGDKPPQKVEQNNVAKIPLVNPTPPSGGTPPVGPVSTEGGGGATSNQTTSGEKEVSSSEKPVKGPIFEGANLLKASSNAKPSQPTREQGKLSERHLGGMRGVATDKGSSKLSQSKDQQSGSSQKDSSTKEEMITAATAISSPSRFEEDRRQFPKLEIKEFPRKVDPVREVKV